MLNARTRYGLKALIHLARQETDRLVTVAEIAAVHGIPKRFLDTILTELRNAGVVESRRARYGGYRLRSPPRDIPVSDILRLLDGPRTSLPCSRSAAGVSCDGCAPDTCEVRLFMQRVRDAIDEVALGTSLQDLASSSVPWPVFDIVPSRSIAAKP